MVAAALTKTATWARWGKTSYWMAGGGLRVPDLSQANVGFQALDDRVCSNHWSSFWPFLRRARSP